MEKGQTVEVVIEDMSREGQGIGRAEGLVLFVSGAVPGDRVRARITKMKKNYAFSRMTELVEPSAHRNMAFDCVSFERGCGGCPYGLMKYDAQLALKERQLRDKLQRLAGLEHPVVRSIIPMGEADPDGFGPSRYRNKAQFPVSTGGIVTRKGGIVENLGEPAVGFYRAKSHQVIDCGDCYLQSPAAMAAADALRRFMTEDHITAWDPRWRKGLMRHLIVKTAFATGEVMAILVINGNGIPNVHKLVKMLDDAVYRADYSLESVVLSIKKSGGTSLAGGRQSKSKNGKLADLQSRAEDSAREGKGVLGDRNIVIAGKGVITDRIGHLQFEISPESFYQVNPVQTKRLYDQVRKYCGFGVTGEVSGAGRVDGCPDVAVGEDADGSGRSGAEGGPFTNRKPVVLDLYCGVGSIGLYCADEAEMVIGIEAVGDAVKDANRNAVINGIVNARYICGRAEDVLSLYAAYEPEREESGCGTDGYEGMDEMAEDDRGAEARTDRNMAETDRAKISSADRDPAVTTSGGTLKDNGGINGKAQGAGIRSRDTAASVDPEIAAWVKRADIAIVDPPRAGCKLELLEAVADVGVDRIVYVSCDPATLARDIKILTNLGYAFVEATPVDMFPWTGHVETVCLLSRKVR